MSYDLAVWVPASPYAGLSPDDAYELLCDRMDEHDAYDEPVPPAISEFVAELLTRWPALGEAGDDDSPWAMGPEIGDTLGPAIYITMTYPGAGFAVPVIAEVARRRGLVCYDPQLEEAI